MVCDWYNSDHGITAVAILEFAVDCTVLWNALLDVDNYPVLFSTVVAVERSQHSHGPLRLGSTYAETNIVLNERNCQHPSVWTWDVVVVSIDDMTTKFPKSLRFKAEHMGCTITATYAVEPIEDGKCRLVTSYAMTPNTLLAKFYTWFYRGDILREMDEALTINLEDYCKACTSSRGQADSL